MDRHGLMIAVITVGVALAGLILTGQNGAKQDRLDIRQDLRSFQEITAAALREAAAERAEIRERLARIEAIVGGERTVKHGQAAR